MTTEPIIKLECCICGKDTKGRQWPNRDKGYGLGACCVEFALRTTPGGDAQFEKNYGVRGTHFDVMEVRATL